MYYLVYDLETNKAVSYGSVLADPMPEYLGVRPLSEEEKNGVLEGRLVWNEVNGFFQTPSMNIETTV